MTVAAIRRSNTRSTRAGGRVSRRGFLAAASGLASSVLTAAAAEQPAAVAETTATALDISRLDLHVHLDNSSIDRVLELSRERGVTFGIVEHAGTKENEYPVVISDDEELKRYLAMLEGRPVYRGVQAEWIDWAGCFSPAVLGRLDYVLTDTMTFPGKDGRRVKLWDKDVESRVEMANKQAFMDRYVDWCVQILEKQPVDILGNVSWLPGPLAYDYGAFWTPERIRRLVDAAVEHRVALEISSSFRLPELAFLRMAKAAGVKFSFGSNGRFPHMGKLDYCLDMAGRLGLTRGDMFVPAADGQRAVQRRHVGG